MVVRDGEIIYSTSEGRGQESHMVVHDHSGNELGSYTFPNMSEGVVEVDGEILTTFESGAQEYADWEHWYDEYALGDLWAGPSMTRTPLSELGIDGELEAEPDTLDKAAGVLGDPAAALTRTASILDGVSLPSSSLGQVPSAGKLCSTVETLVDGSARSARTASSGIERLADALEAAGADLQRTDSGIGSLIERLNPW